MQQIKRNLEGSINDKKAVFLFTGNKESTLLMSIVKDLTAVQAGLPARQSGMDVNIIFIDTGYQFNEIIDYVKSYGSKIEAIKNSKASIVPTIRNDIDECCFQRKAEVLNEYLDSVNAELLIVPFRSEERDNGIEYSYLSLVNNIKVIKPLADLTEREVWIKIKEYKLPFSTIYNKGYTIVDCKCCATRHGRKKDEKADKTNELDNETKETEEKLKSLGYM